MRPTAPGIRRIRKPVRIADKWMDWTTSSFAGPFRTVFWGVLRTPADKQDWAAINAAIKECNELLSMADQALASQPYLSGDRHRHGRYSTGQLHLCLVRDAHRTCAASYICKPGTSA